MAGHPFNAPASLPPLPLDPQKWAEVSVQLRLSPQQARIVELILRNCCDKQIAERMGLRVPTIRTYITRIFTRLGVSDRLELVLHVFALASGVTCRHP